MNNRLAIIGAGGHGKVIADIAKKAGYTDIVFLDDNASYQECNGCPIVGTSAQINNYLDRDFIVAIGNAQVRKKIHLSLAQANAQFATLIHPNATIGDAVSIGKGSVVMAGAVINPCANIGEGCIVNTCASVDHDCALGEYVHIAVGAHVAGSVTIGAGTWIGAGATIINDIEIIGDCVIGAGAVVVHSITQTGTYIGVPARKLH